MRIRTIKPEWLDDEKIAASSDAARTLSVGLIVMADDHGNGRAHPGFISSRVWPYAGDDVRELAASLEKACAALAELEGIGFLTRYRVKGQIYYSLTNWTKHQRVDNAGKPRVPGPLESDEEDSPRTRRELAANSPRKSVGSRLDPDPDPDQDQDQDPRAEPPSVSGDGPVHQLWDYFLRCRQTCTTRSPPKLTTKTRAQIRRRLKTYGETELAAAIAELFRAGTFHATEGHIAPQFVFRSDDQVQLLLDRAAKHAPAEPSPPEPPRETIAHTVDPSDLFRGVGT